MGNVSISCTILVGAEDTRTNGCNGVHLLQLRTRQHTLRFLKTCFLHVRTLFEVVVLRVFFLCVSVFFASNLCADIRSLPRSKIGSPIIDPTDIRVALTPRTIDIPIVFATEIPYMGLYGQWELEVRKVFHHPLSTGSLLTVAPCSGLDKSTALIATVVC